MAGPHHNIKGAARALRAARIRRLLAEGLSHRDIAARLGLSSGAVSRIAQRLAVEGPA